MSHISHSRVGNSWWQLLGGGIICCGDELPTPALKDSALAPQFCRVSFPGHMNLAPEQLPKVSSELEICFDFESFAVFSAQESHS